MGRIEGKLAIVAGGAAGIGAATTRRFAAEGAKVIMADIDDAGGGAVIARDKNILATGYNGSLRGLPHCDEEGHMMEDGHCVRTIHAEANAIIQAAKNGAGIDGGTLFCKQFCQMTRIARGPRGGDANDLHLPIDAREYHIEFESALLALL